MDTAKVKKKLTVYDRLLVFRKKFLEKRLSAALRSTNRDKLRMWMCCAFYEGYMTGRRVALLERNKAMSSQNDGR